MLTFACVATAACAAFPQTDGTAPATVQPRFAAPVMLTADGEPLGGKLMYPSPRLYDIDQDGVAELVLGDLRGQMHVSERVDGDSLAAWSAIEPLVTGGRPLKFHNW